MKEYLSDQRVFFFVFQVKIWFQNRRSKYKKMMKAAQQVVTNPGQGGPGHGLLGGNPPHTPGMPGSASPQPPGGGLIGT